MYSPFVYINQDYIKKDSVEKRQYQLNIARSAANKNTLVVLPTGLGKTIIALLLISNQLKSKDEKILFLAPTKPLVTQHAKFLKEFLTIEEEKITIFTGEVPPSKRKELLEGSKILISTPQVIENDLLSKNLNLKNFSLIVFDEAHHAVGEYAYVFISEMYQKQREKNRLVLGITASPGNDSSKILDVCKNLDVENIEIRTKHDPDVKPYVHDLNITWKEITLPKDFAYAIQILRKALSERLKILKNIGAVDSASISLINRTKLLDAQKKIQAEIRSTPKPSKAMFKAASIQSEAMKIHYALELLQTQGADAFKNYFQRMNKEAYSKKSSKASRNLMSDGNIIEAVAYVKSLNVEHPKLYQIKKIVSDQIKNNPNSKIIVFTHYRDTSTHVSNILKDVKNIRPVRFIGQAAKGKDKGLSQKKQAEVIKKFKEGDYNVLIATSVAEEGLDIPSTDLVVFYEPVPSEIRVIQRRGRTGRKMPGKVIILITKGTSDEGYYWSAKRKEKRMRSELEFLRSKLSKNLEDAKTIYEKKQKEESAQKQIKDFEKKNNDVKIIVDHREYRSDVVKNLAIGGTFVEPQQLDTGDYILSSRIGVERKTVDDYLESLISGKIFKQTSKLRETYSRPILIIEGENLLTSRNINHNAIFGSLASISVDFGIPILKTKDASETADLLKVIAKREQNQDKKSVSVRGEKTAMSLKEQQQFIIEGLPNVSSVIAKRLLDYFGSVKDIFDATEDELTQVPGVGKNTAKAILEIIHANYLKE